MRFDRFTHQLQTAVSDAQSLAVGGDQSQIEPVHLLSALLDQSGGSLQPLLQNSGFDIGALRSDVANALEALPKLSAPTGEVTLSSALGRLLNLADKHAQQNGDSYIATEALVLAARILLSL